MDFDFPLILMIAVAVSGVIWLLDIFVFSKKRDADDHEPILIEYSKSFFPVLFLVFFLRSFLFEPFQIPSGSMIPTLKVGDFILVNKFSYGVRMPVFQKKLFDVGEPERGDVVVFFPPNVDKYYIKRLIGVPGDKVRIDNHVLFINGAAVKYEALSDEELVEFKEILGTACGFSGTNQIVKEHLGENPHYVQKCSQPSRISNSGSWTVPEDQYLMMGDNRDNSSDGRIFGMVPEENLVGRAFAIWMHWPELTSVPSFSRTGAIQ